MENEGVSRRREDGEDHVVWFALGQHVVDAIIEEMNDNGLPCVEENNRELKSKSSRSLAYCLGHLSRSCQHHA